MTQDKVSPSFFVGIGKPAPGKHILSPNHDIFSKRLNNSHKYVRVCLDVFVEDDLPLQVEDTHIHLLGVETDATVVLMLLSIRFDLTSSFWG